MTLSTALSQEFARRSAAAHQGHYKANSNVGTEREAISYSSVRAPLSHPVVEKLAGKRTKDQIRIVIVDRCQFLGEFPARRVLDDRCTRVEYIYKDLAALNYDMPLVTSFGLKHAMALLENWKSRKLARKTIYNRWCSLRSWTLTLNKQGMIGPLQEHWPEFEQDSKPTVGYRILTPEQIQERSDYLKEQKDKTVYLVDRLHREVGMARDQALELNIDAVRGIAMGDDVLRCGHGASGRIIKDMGLHQELMREAANFMASRNREKLAWTGLTTKESLAKYSLRMSYINRTRYADAPKATAEVSSK